eukprot:TRINITY_DN57481_c0_g1_i1.p1 TRINITY_DN57481_c0_g1~~TRINITY_DN57481_c0_g1_i1.p1  ORF type:complete len:488 (-),score=103.76 TRINITY_DN57481_c0_g1_i1:251-1714(-)
MYTPLPLMLLRFHHDLHVHNRLHHPDEDDHIHDDEDAEMVEQRRRRRPARRTVWVRDWLSEDVRRQSGHFYTLIDINQRDMDHRMFKNYTRISLDMFLEMLDRIRPDITKEDTRMRSALEPGLKLAVTLRYMATGDSYPSLAYSFRVSVPSICNFLPAVCQAIIDAYSREAFPLVWGPEMIKTLSDEFYTRWNMPHTFGALDGKHVAIKKPKNTGSLYHNYKGFFSIPLMALVSADYQFVWATTGGQGHMSDAQIWGETALKRKLEDGTIVRPAPCPLTDDPADTTPVPYFIVSDDAFALKEWCMKPFSRRTMAPREVVFNYRLSRARRVVENAFGLLAQRFRCLLRTIELQPENVRLVIKCCTTLHNILIQRKAPVADAVDREDVNHEVIPGVWREQVMWQEPDQPRAGRADNPGKRVRETLADFFGSPAGLVPWQWERAHVQRPAPVPVPAAAPAPAADTQPANTQPAADGPDGPPAQPPPPSAE